MTTPTHATKIKVLRELTELFGENGFGLEMKIEAFSLIVKVTLSKKIINFYRREVEKHSFNINLTAASDILNIRQNFHRGLRSLGLSVQEGENA